jgi:hypothetical protein
MTINKFTFMFMDMVMEKVKDRDTGEDTLNVINASKFRKN